MPELTQRMIDAGATFFDSSGIPTRPDGTPALEENRPEGILDLIAQRGTGSDPANTDNPLAYNFGPGYTPTAQDYPENRTPLAPPVFNLGMGSGQYENGVETLATQPEGALVFNPGDPYAMNWQDFKSRDRSTGGGFFTAQDLFGADLPSVFQLGADLPSTNNWRLIPGGAPGLVMRNGQIINLNDVNSLYGPYGRPSMGWEPPRWRGGADTPSAYAPGVTAANIIGWPGSGSNSMQSATAGY